MKISEADVEYVAKLANLDIPDDQKTELANQLSRIVEHIEQLNRLDVTNVAPTCQVVTNTKHAIREDLVQLRPGSSEAGKTIKLFKVPKVITER
jgi:aspartyl/glutamyl-tRNA(Asn/Gln) amidotransferase C subunit